MYNIILHIWVFLDFITLKSQKDITTFSFFHGDSYAKFLSSRFLVLCRFESYFKIFIPMNVILNELSGLKRIFDLKFVFDYKNYFSFPMQNYHRKTYFL